MLLPKDYVRFRLTGERATDVADASGTLLFDVANRRWSAEVAGVLDIDLALLPRAFESPEVTGTVNAAGAAATGLRAGTPVVAGGGDQAAGAVGIGHRRGRAGQRHHRHVGRRVRRDQSSRPSIPRAASTPSATPSRACGTSWA